MRKNWAMCGGASAHEQAFGAGGTRIENIHTHGRKISLRIYLFGERPWSLVTVRLRSPETRALLGERTFDMERFTMFENGDLRTDFGDYKSDAIDIEIAVPPDMRVWAFATAADDSGQTQVHLPAQ